MEVSKVAPIPASAPLTHNTEMVGPHLNDKDLPAIITIHLPEPAEPALIPTTCMDARAQSRIAEPSVKTKFLDPISILLGNRVQSETCSYAISREQRLGMYGEHGSASTLDDKENGEFKDPMRPGDALTMDANEKSLDLESLVGGAQNTAVDKSPNDPKNSKGDAHTSNTEETVEEHLNAKKTEIGLASSSRSLANVELEEATKDSEIPEIHTHTTDPKFKGKEAAMASPPHDTEVSPIGYKEVVQALEDLKSPKGDAHTMELGDKVKEVGQMEMALDETTIGQGEAISTAATEVKTHEKDMHTPELEGGGIKASTGSFLDGFEMIDPDLDEATIQAIIAIQIADLEDALSTAASKGKGKADAPLPDSQIAMDSYRNHLLSASTIALDFKLALSIDTALAQDFDLISLINAQEDIALRDRQIALDMTEGREHDSYSDQHTEKGQKSFTTERVPGADPIYGLGYATSSGTSRNSFSGEKLVKEATCCSCREVRYCVTAPCDDTYCHICLTQLFRNACVDEEL